jgi:hypothetical protein
LRVETLISRYPNLSEGELAEIISLFPSLPILDRAIMTADNNLSGKLAAFEQDHHKAFKAPLSSLILFMAVPVVVAIFVAAFMLLN